MTKKGELNSDRQRDESMVACRALVARAAESVKNGEPDRAIADLIEAHDLHVRAGNALDASHCACQAATIARLGGALQRGRELASLALDCAGGDDDLVRAAAIELAEVELLDERPAEAARHLSNARSRVAGASRHLQIAMAMKHAESLQLAGEHDQAEDAWAASESLASDSAELAALLVRRASLLCGSKSPIAPGAIVRAKLVAQSAGSRRALADVALLECASCLDLGELEGAVRAAENAREHALACESVMVYVSAAAILARLHNQCGDRLEAYRSLAVGWVTVSDLLGAELARANFAPLMAGLRSDWGQAAFAQIKESVEAE